MVYSRLTNFRDAAFPPADLRFRIFVRRVCRETMRKSPGIRDHGISRITRAVQLDFLKIYLPKEKWITYEQDLEYRYLRPYIEEIVMERMEIYEFGCTNYSDHDWPAGELK